MFTVYSVSHFESKQWLEPSSRNLAQWCKMGLLTGSCVVVLKLHLKIWILKIHDGGRQSFWKTVKLNHNITAAVWPISIKCGKVTQLALLTQQEVIHFSICTRRHASSVYHKSVFYWNGRIKLMEPHRNSSFLTPKISAKFHRGHPQQARQMHMG